MQNFIFMAIFLSLNLKDIGLNLKLIESASAKEDAYAGCGKSRFCFGVNNEVDNCITSKKCDLVTSIVVQKSSNVANIRIEGRVSTTEGWIALGFSDDMIMGKDLCIVCVKTSNGGPFGFFSWNPDGEADSVFIDPSTITNGAVLSLKKHESTNKKFYCEFETSTKIAYRGHVFDLIEDEYHILLALGGAPVTSKTISGHSPSNRWALGKRVSLLRHENFHSTSNAHSILIQVHGIMMVISSMFFMSVGAFVARFFKQTLIEVECCGKRIWFTVHMSFMYCAVAIAIVALILVMISRFQQGNSIFPLHGSFMNHAYVGLTTILIMCLQSTVIWWTPSFRKELTTVHSLFGILIYYMAWYNVTFSQIDTDHGPVRILMYGVAWICISLFFYIGMTLLQLWDDRIEEGPVQYHQRIFSDPYRALKIPMKISSLGEDPNKTLRLVILGIYVLAFFVLAVCATMEIGVSKLF